MAEADVLFRRLAARGYFEITPLDRSVAAGTETDSEGRIWEISKVERVVRLLWAPAGQGGPGGDNRFNPFCSRAWTAPTLPEVLAKAVEATRPPEHSLETLVDHWLYEKGSTR